MTSRILNLLEEKVQVDYPRVYELKVEVKSNNGRRPLFIGLESDGSTSHSLVCLSKHNKGGGACESIIAL